MKRPYKKEIDEAWSTKSPKPGQEKKRQGGGGREREGERGDTSCCFFILY